MAVTFNFMLVSGGSKKKTGKNLVHEYDISLNDSPHSKKYKSPGLFCIF